MIYGLIDKYLLIFVCLKLVACECLYMTPSPWIHLFIHLFKYLQYLNKYLMKYLSLLFKFHFKYPHQNPPPDSHPV
jgi:hypothetical protein